MPQFYRGKKIHCVFYAQMQRSVRDSFLCTGAGFWARCPDYLLCRLLEVRRGEPKPYDPDKPKGKLRPFAEAA